MSVNRPAWSYPERRPKPRVQSGLRFVGGAKCWCYLCNSEHPWGVACGSLPEPEPPRLSIAGAVPCTACGSVFVPSAFTRGVNRYCSPRCRLDVKSAKARKGYDGRYD